jgi:hypothetical protein
MWPLDAHLYSIEITGGFHLLDARNLEACRLSERRNKPRWEDKSMVYTFTNPETPEATSASRIRRIKIWQIVVRTGLAGVALLLWQTKSAKAQECCPDQYNETEVAKVEKPAKKPVSQAASKKHDKVAEGVKSVPNAETSAKATHTKNSKAHAKPAAFPQNMNGTQVINRTASFRSSRLHLELHDSALGVENILI